MRKLIIGILCLGAMGLSACNVSAEAGGKKVVDADIGGGNSESYSYEMSCNGCETGEQKFDRRENYCSALVDESKNNGCCRREREDAYNRDCQ